MQELNHVQKSHGKMIQRYKDTASAGELIDEIQKEQGALAIFKATLCKAHTDPVLRAAPNFDNAVKLVEQIVSDIESWIADTKALIGVA